MRGGAVSGSLLCGNPPDGARCSSRAGLQQHRSFVEMCIVSSLSASTAYVCVSMWSGGCNLGLPSLLLALLS
jgi:hypothetical protein